jgi:hypothetical protein
MIEDAFAPRATLRATFQLDGMGRKELNLILTDRDTGKPLPSPPILPKRMVEELALLVDAKMGNPMILAAGLQKMRDARDMQIDHFFKECARTIKDELRAQDGLENAMQGRAPE